MCKTLSVITLVASVVVLIGWTSIRAYKGYVMHRDCIGYLKQAADANTVPIAKERLQKAINYLEKNELTNGVTTIIFNMPSNDIGFWYRNLKASLGELDIVTEKSSPLEKSNMLMKLRETLVDHGEHGVGVTCPPGISVYPNNFIFALIGCFSFIFVILSGVFLIIFYDY